MKTFQLWVKIGHVLILMIKNPQTGDNIMQNGLLFSSLFCLKIGCTLTFAPVIMRSVKVNFKNVLPATRQVSFTKCNSAAALHPSAAPLLSSHHLTFGRSAN